MPVPEPKLSAIIISFNTRELTLKCLRVLAGELTGLDAEVIVVDNASTDDSAAAIRDEFPSALLVVNERNLGFGGANNVAFARARGRYLLLLNSDAFPRPGAVAALVRLLDERTEVGVVGPRLLNPDGSLQLSCFPFPTPLHAWLDNLWLTRLAPNGSGWGDYRRWDHASERPVDFVIGACLLTRRAVYEQVGGFDERFFMYQEEADWQRRIKKAGWGVVFSPVGEVVHLAGASGKDGPVQTNRYFFESLDRYVLKHHGWAGFLLVRAAMLAGCALRAVAWTLAACWPKKRLQASRRARQHAWLFGRQLLTAPPSAKHP